MSPVLSPQTRTHPHGEAESTPWVINPRRPVDVLDTRRSHRPVQTDINDGEDSDSASQPASVLLAGGDERGRESLRAEFASTLPERTRWVEADDVAEVLERAAHSRMVILAGDLHDADAQASMRLLGHRHPELPVICVDTPPSTLTGGHD